MTLLAMADKLFGRLSAAENCILSAASRGEVANCSGTHDYWSSANDPKSAHEWDDSRNVRASILTWLYLDPVAIKQVHVTGITIWGAKIIGKVDFLCATLAQPIEIDRCFIPDGIDLSFAETRTLIFRGCVIGYVRAPRLTVRGDVLCAGSEIRGLVDLYETEISGDADFRGVRIITGRSEANKILDALGAELARISRHFRFEDGFQTDGIVRLVNARVEGNVSFRGAAFVGSNENGLDAKQVFVGGTLEWLPASHTDATVLAGCGKTSISQSRRIY